MPSGSTLKYEILFRPSEDFCNNPPSNPLFYASLEGENICLNHFEFPNINIAQNLAATLNTLPVTFGGVTCCIPVPTLTITHVCGAAANNGSISIANPSPNLLNPIEITLFYPITCAAQPCSTVVNTLNDPNIIINNLGVGLHHLVIFDPNNGGYFEQDVIIENHQFTATISSNLTTVSCGNTNIVLTALPDPAISISGSSYEYLWSTGAIQNQITAAPTASIAYTVEISNGTCTTTASIQVDVLTTPSSPIINNITICQNNPANLNPPIVIQNSTPSTIQYSWSIPPTIIPGSYNSYTPPNPPTQTTTYEVTAMDYQTGCFSMPTQVTATVVQASITASSPNPPFGPVSICGGSTVTLTTSNPLGLPYGHQWFRNSVSGLPAIPILGGINPTLTVNSSGDYWVHISYAGCSVSSNIVSVLVDPSVSIIGPSSACDQTAQYCLPSYFPTTEVLYWTLNGQSIPHDLGNPLCVTIDWSSINYIGGILEVNTNAICGSSGIVAIEVNPCCDPLIVPTITENSWSQFSSLSNPPLLFSPNVAGASSYSISSETFVLDNTSAAFICDASLTFTDCNIYMAAGTQFRLNNNINIFLDNTRIKACEYRHKGINADQGSSNVHILNGSIQGADIAVRITSGDLLLFGAGFDRNLNHVYAQQSTVTVNGGDYKCTGYIVPVNSIPAAPQTTIYSIYLKNCTLDVPNVSNANFYDAMFGISTYQSGLICGKNYFDNCVKGVNIWNSTYKPDQECTIGLYNLENTFINCSQAIAAGGNLTPCKIDGNKIINATDFGIKLQLLRGRYFTINGNHICNAKTAIYSYLNATSLPGQGTQNAKKINGNYINWDCPLNNFPNKGIIVEEATITAPATGTQVHLEIVKNGIWDCRHGIDVTNLNLAKIVDNRILVHPDLTGTSAFNDYANGIGLSACNNMKVINNLVSSEASINPSNNDWAISGIRIAASPNTMVCGNSTSGFYVNNLHPFKGTPLQIGDPFEFLGVSFPSVFKNNEILNYTSRGLYMGGMDFNSGANGTIIGPQYDLNINFNPPLSITINTRDNEWDNMYPINGAVHTDFNNVDGGLNKFYMTYSTVTPISFENTSQSPFGSIPQYTFQSTVLPFPTLGCGTNRSANSNRDAYDDIALDSIIKLGGNDTSRYFSKEFLYSQIKHNDTLVSVAALASFKTAADNTNLKYIDEMKEGLIFPLDSIGVDSLQAKYDMILPDNNIEKNYKIIYEITLKNPEMRDSVYLPDEIEKLQEIAQLCPFTDGNAVYMARVILHGIEPGKDYYNYCEFAKDPRRTSNERLSGNPQNNKTEPEPLASLLEPVYKIIPNPNSGIFKLICESNSTIKCELFDISGRVIESGNYKPVDKLIPFDFSGITKGIYNLRVIDKGRAITFKVIIN